MSSVRKHRSTAGRDAGAAGGATAAQTKDAQFAQVDEISVKDETVMFTLSKCDVSLANALRRILIAEVRRRRQHVFSLLV